MDQPMKIMLMAVAFMATLIITVAISRSDENSVPMSKSGQRKEIHDLRKQVKLLEAKLQQDEYPEIECIDGLHTHSCDKK